MVQHILQERMIHSLTKYLLLIFLALVVAANPVQSQTNPKHVKVKGYYRKDGTYVRPHYRTAPNSTNRDNFSTRGNVNPYTGKPGWIQPDDNHSSILNKQTSTRKKRAQRSPALVTNYDEQRRVGRYPDGYIYATTKSDGQLWEGPSQMNVMRAIPRNSFVKIVDCEGEFWKVICNGTTGYVHTVIMNVNDDMLPMKAKAKRRYQSATHSNYGTNVTSTYSVKKQVKEIEYVSWSTVRPGNCALNNRKNLTDYYFVVQTAYLNNKPTNQGKPVGKLSFGDKVNVICSEGEWYEIVYRNKTGWIEKRLLRK